MSKKKTKSFEPRKAGVTSKPKPKQKSGGDKATTKEGGK